MATKIKSDWMTWIGQNLIRGVDPEVLRKELIKRGVSRPMANSAVDEVLESPLVQTGLQTNSVRRKVEALLDVYAELFKVSEQGQNVCIPEETTSDEFFEKYYSTNRPVVLKGLVDSWPARQWTPRYFAERFGHVRVQVTRDRNRDSAYELNVKNHLDEMLLSEFVKLVESNPDTNDIYLVAQNHALEMTELAPLVEELGNIGNLLDLSFKARSLRMLWFGPGGTVTPWHHDRTNILFVQLYGRKRFQLVPSFQLPYMQNNIGVFSAVDCGIDTSATRELPSQLIRKEVVLCPGEVLFIPVGWWHHVTSIDVSISVGLQNFRVPGCNTEWKQPPLNRYS